MRMLIGWAFAIFVFTLRSTCRRRVTNDSRGRLREQGIPYIYAALHAHNVAALMSAEQGTCAMVSRSADGEILVPALRVCNITPIRGSAGSARKGGVTALRAAINYVDESHACCIAVDGPKGPRGKVQKGVTKIAEKTNAVILPVVLIPRQRLTLKKTWDRLQIPLPFTVLDVVFADPMTAQANESASEFANRIAISIRTLELKYDHNEAMLAGSVADDITEQPQEPLRRAA